MRIFLQYFFWLLSVGTLVVFYFLNTYAGHQNMGYLVEDYLSAKMNNRVKVYSLNIEKYPYIEMELQINGEANATVKGEVDNNNIKMYYHLIGDSFKFNSIDLNEKIDIEGDLSGALSSLNVRGNGKIFDGDMSFSFTKVPKKIENLKIDMQQVDGQKLANFLNQPIYFSGLVDVDANFKSFSKHEKEGRAKIYIPKGNLLEIAKGEPFELNSTVDFRNREYFYRGEITSHLGRVIFRNGEYFKAKKIAKVDYDLHLNDLAHFEKILKHQFRGSLDTEGTALYENGLELNGRSDKFGGELKYHYKKENLDLKLKAISLERLLEQFSYPLLFSSKVYGEINYNMKEKIILINTDLKETRFRKTRLANILYHTSGIDLLSETYDKSSFYGGYQNSILSSRLKIDNGREHIYLTKMKMNAINNKVNANFEIKMQGQEFYGNIYGTLKEPKVSLDMKRLLKYQMNKKMSEWLGEDKIEKVKDGLNGVKKDLKEKLKELDVKM